MFWKSPKESPFQNDLQIRPLCLEWANFRVQSLDTKISEISPIVFCWKFYGFIMMIAILPDYQSADYRALKNSSLNSVLISSLMRRALNNRL